MEQRSDDRTGRDYANADLGGANLGGVDFSDADLSGADLGDAHLGGADLGDADLSDVSFDGANLAGADLSGAELDGADFTGANLKGANLVETDLDGATLAGANLKDARLTKRDEEATESSRWSVAAVAGAVLVALGFALLATGSSAALAAPFVGLGAVLLVARAAVGTDDSSAVDSASGPNASEAQAIDELRDRYARGDIGDAAFERRIEQVLEAESDPDHGGRAAGSDDDGSERETERV